MKIVFVAPRFHTNQKEIIRELVARGNEVHFFSVYLGAIEDHSIVTPLLLPAKGREVRNVAQLKNENEYVRNFELDINEFSRRLNSIVPNLVIIRGKSKSMRKIHTLCRRSKYSTVLYDQAPLFEERLPLWRKIGRAFLNWNVPHIRYTPVVYSNYNQKQRADALVKSSKKAYYVPFAVEHNTREKTMYMWDDELHVIDVGKYRDYKNHYVLLRALLMCRNKDRIKVSIVGQAIKEEEIEFYNKMKAFCEDNGLIDNVNMVKNVSPRAIGDYYKSNDVLVLCSHMENASISVLEAMSYGLSVISTENNGTAFILNSSNGRIFNPEDPVELANILDEYCDKPNLASVLGCEAKKYIEQNHSAINYIDAFNELLADSKIGGTV